MYPSRTFELALQIAGVIAFHEKASPSQVHFLFFLFFMAERYSERPGAVKGAFWAASANP